MHSIIPHAWSDLTLWMVWPTSQNNEKDALQSLSRIWVLGLPPSSRAYCRMMQLHEFHSSMQFGNTLIRWQQQPPLQLAGPAHTITSWSLCPTPLCVCFFQLIILLFGYASCESQSQVWKSHTMRLSHSSQYDRTQLVSLLSPTIVE